MSRDANGMALIKEDQMSNGYTAEYWVPVATMDAINNIVKIVMHGFKDKATFEADGASITKRTVPTSQTCFADCATMLAYCHSSILDEDENETNWFSDAEVDE